MFSDPSRVREARLFARPNTLDTNLLQLTYEPAAEDPARLRIAKRLIAAYRCAIEDAAVAPVKAADSDLWTAIVAEHMPDLVGILNAGDAAALARFLQSFGMEYTWFGGLTLGLDGYFRARDAGELAFVYIDEIARTTTGFLISLNQEAQAPISDSRRHLWVAGLLAGDARFARIRRSPYWMREGYVEEIYRIAGPA